MVVRERCKVALAAAVLASLGCQAWAAEGSDAGMRTLPASAMLGFERVRLPGNERLGLLAGGYVAELAPGWWLGPAVVGAATGQRGGLFTWGLETQRRWRIAQAMGLATGLYVGGGGGASAPVGGGLMLRPHADLMIDFGGWQAGITASHLRFPTGNIRSTQLGLQLMVDDRFAFTAPGHAGERVSFDRRGGIGADRMHPTVGLYSNRHDAGGKLGYVGLRLEQQATKSLVATLEAAGAAAGGADGYMEALGGLALKWPVMDSGLLVGGRVAAGLAGGGAVKTGGGPIGKAGVTARWQASPRFSVELEAGAAKAFNGEFAARYAQLSLGMALSDPDTGGLGATQQTLDDMEWGFSLQHYAKAARKDGSERDMQLVGLKFNRALSPHLYLSGQAHSAVAGGAGAYSVGLVGLGARARLGGSSGWQAGAEALVGAAGGGGVDVRGGAVAQPMAWVGTDLGRYSRLKLAGGWIKSRRGGLSSPVAELTWSLEFGVP